MIRSGVLGKAVLGQSAGAEVSVQGNIDAKIAVVSLTPSSTEIYTQTNYFDSNTSIVALVASGVDTYIVPTIDTNTAKVTLTPVGTAEAHTTFDSNTGIIKITPSTYESKVTRGIVTKVIPPRDSVQYGVFLLKRLEEQLNNIKRNKRPTMPIYDRNNFPQDAITSQHAIATDGSLWVYFGGWVLIAGA